MQILLICCKIHSNHARILQERKQEYYISRQDFLLYHLQKSCSENTGDGVIYREIVIRKVLQQLAIKKTIRNI